MSQGNMTNKLPWKKLSIDKLSGSKSKLSIFLLQSLLYMDLRMVCKVVPLVLRDTCKVVPLVLINNIHKVLFKVHNICNLDLKDICKVVPLVLRDTCKVVPLVKSRD
jgi:hypothetical protein